jgi:hypothetical protein
LFEDVKGTFGLGSKYVIEGTNCRAHFILSLAKDAFEINTTLLGKCEFPGKILCTAMNFQK